MIRSLRIGVGCLCGIALIEMLQPVARAFELRALRELSPERFDAAAAIAAVIDAIAQDGLALNPE